MNIAINGFGRIGRNFLRALLLDTKAAEKITVVAINCGPDSPDECAYLFKYDSLLGIYPGTVTFQDGTLIVDSKKIKLLSFQEPTGSVWSDLGVEWVVDCSGMFTDAKKAQLHRDAGASYVLISAPSHSADRTIILGVNDADFDPARDHIVSLGSCTSNAIVPVLFVLQKECGFKQGFMSTIHAYTNSQALLDVSKRDKRMSRAAALNIIPATTGAASLVNAVLPQLRDAVGMMAFRVPVAKVSCIDLTFVTQKALEPEIINAAFKKAESTYLSSIMAYTEEPLVSSDFSGNAHSVIVDGLCTQTQGTLAKVCGWYDNEWGYSMRLKDFLVHL